MVFDSLETHMQRRTVIKLLSAGAATSVFAQPALSVAAQELHAPVDLNRIPQAPTGAQPIENAPERLIASEPELALAPDGQLSISWTTMVPTKGATIYLGVPNNEVRLEYPIYSGSTELEEDAAGTNHKAIVDVRAYAIRVDAQMLFAGGVMAYRIEIFDPRRSVSRFIDRRFRFAVENDSFRRVPDIVEGPNVSMVDESHATIWWVTDLPVDGQVTTNGKTVPAVIENGRYLARIDQLSPQTNYEYTVSLGSGQNVYRTRTYSFQSGPTEPDFSFVFTCDGRTGGLGGGATALEGINGESGRALSIQMDRHRPAFLIFTGDLISGYTSMVEDFRAQLRSWKRVYGPLWRWMPIYTGMGNHESLVNLFDQRRQTDKTGNDSAEAVFASEFVHPMNGPEPERPGFPPYRGAVYSFRFGGCHFVQLNSDYWYSSNPDELGGNYFGRLLPGQLDWFEQDLAAARRDGAKHIFVFIHEPAFPNGGHVSDALWGGGVTEGVTARDRFWKAVSEARAVAVFSGHEHNYSRMRIDAETPVHPDLSPNPEFRNPVWQVIQGAAGAPFYPQDRTTPWQAHVDKFVSHTWSYCHVTVKGSSVKLETFSATGELLDEATLAS